MSGHLHVANYVFMMSVTIMGIVRKASFSIQVDICGIPDNLLILFFYIKVLFHPVLLKCLQCSHQQSHLYSPIHNQLMLKVSVQCL